MAEAAAEEVAAEPAAVAEAPAVETAPEVELEPAVTEHEDDDKEPGGSDGASVYARRKAREAKQLRTELEQERSERIRAEERAKVLAEQANRPAPKQAERVYTIEELDAAVEAQTITAADRARYIDQVIIPHRIDERLNAREQAQQQKQPIEKAKADVNEYMNLIPALQNKSSEEFRKVATEYQELIALGYPADDRTERTAAKLVFGSLETLRKRAEVSSLSRRAPNMPVDGSGGVPPARPSDYSKAPPEFQKFWDQTGTSAKDRQNEWERYQAKQKK